MKKVFIISAAIALTLSSASCSSKKDSSSEIIPETDNIEIQEDTAVFEQIETAGETAPVQYREYKDSDFTDINVNVSTRFELPYEENSAVCDLEWIDRRRSPCSYDDQIEKYRPDYFDNITDEEIKQQYLDNWSKPIHGKLAASCADGDDMYFLLNFDTVCNFCSHEFSVYKFNVRTEETEEVFRYSGLDQKVNPYVLKKAKGKLFVELAENTRNVTDERGETFIKNDYYAAWLDTENNKIVSTGVEGNIDAFSYYNSDDLVILCRDEDQSMVQSSDSGFVITGKDNSSGITYKKYDPDTGELQDVGIYTSGSLPMIYKNEALNVTQDEERHAIISCSEFKLETQLRYSTVIADEGRLLVSSPSTWDDVFYVYDFNAMERYILKSDGIGSPIGMFDGNIITNGVNNTYLLIPELGAAIQINNIKPYNGNSIITPDRLYYLSWDFGGRFVDSNGNEYEEENIINVSWIEK